LPAIDPDLSSVMHSSVRLGLRGNLRDGKQKKKLRVSGNGDDRPMLKKEIGKKKKMKRRKEKKKKKETERVPKKKKKKKKKKKNGPKGGTRIENWVYFFFFNKKIPLPSPMSTADQKPRNFSQCISTTYTQHNVATPYQSAQQG
jgi:hypothetical protein